MLHKSNLLKHKLVVENTSVRALIPKTKITNKLLSLLLRLQMRIRFKTINKWPQNIRNWKIRATLFKIQYRTVEIAMNFLNRGKVLWTVWQMFRNKNTNHQFIKYWLSMVVHGCMPNRFQIKRSKMLLCLGSKDYRPSNQIQFLLQKSHLLLKKKFWAVVHLQELNRANRLRWHSQRQIQVIFVQIRSQANFWTWYLAKERKIRWQRATRDLASMTNCETVRQKILEIEA